MTTAQYPPEYVPFEDVCRSLPTPRQVQVSDSVELETLHLTGPDPAIVFVHGGLGSLWNPYPQLAAFEGERELVAYSLAGNGNSTVRPTQSLAGHVSDLRQLLDELQIERPIVHGHSYGTAVAIEYAKRHPTAGVILHAGGDHDLTPAWEKPLLRLFLALRLYRIPVTDALIRQLAYTVGFHEETSRAVVEDFLQSNPLPHRRSAWTTVTDAFWGYDGRSDIDQLGMPTLVIHGPADGIVPVEVARDTANRIPGSVFCRLEGAGHVAMIERPAAYNTLIRALITAIRENRDLETAVFSSLDG
ncbi:alpha/beta fold hydrolase [Halosimplex sp. TS25]|uniref:alpha/beta fold hydrolase n=1 Tax=Halosimplex rarum TaxID=3396619 RepID=UPI0039EA7D7A